MGAIGAIKSENELVGMGSAPVSAHDPARAFNSEELSGIVASKKPASVWPEAISGLYGDSLDKRFYQEQDFLFFLGFLACLATLAIDYVIDPSLLAEGFVLRVFAVGPLTLLGMFAAASRWTNVAKVCLGAGPIAFVAIIVHISVQLSAEATANYLTATALVLGLANLTMPFAMRGVAIFDGAFIVAFVVMLAISAPNPMMHYAEHLALLTIVASSTLPLAYRIERLRQHTFLQTLLAQTASKELIEANLRLRKLSEHDPLTGMPNRRRFEQVFAKQISGLGNPGDAESVLERGRIAVMMIDLDHFKAFNDTHGHQAGDQCLSLLAHSLQRIFEPVGGIVARFGGEEFVAALREQHAGQAETLAEDVRAAIASLSLPDASPITTSVGVALSSPSVALSREELIEMADAALYSAKRNGRNRVELIEIERPVRRRA